MTAKEIVLKCRPGVFDKVDGMIVMDRTLLRNWDEALSILSDEEVVKAVYPEAKCVIGEFKSRAWCRIFTDSHIDAIGYGTTEVLAYADARKRIVENLQEKARTE